MILVSKEPSRSSGKDNMVNLDRSFPRELQPTGLVAVLGGIDGPDRLVEAVISECLIFDRDCAVHNTFSEVLPSSDVLRVSYDNGLGSNVRGRRHLRSMGPGRILCVS